MPDLTPDQRARILAAFQTMDDLAWDDLFVNPAWEHFYYEGYITLQGLLQVAKVIADMHLDSETTA